MLKEILSVFRTDSLMEKAYESSYDMLYTTQGMYREAKRVLRETDDNNIEVDINDQDVGVNKYQREVRKDVFNHLSVQGVDELSSGLVLVSIVIDIERIGDYTKNIVEIAMDHTQRLKAGKLEEDLIKIETAVDDQFDKTIEYFKAADEEKARDLLKQYKWINRTADYCVRSLVRGEDETISSGSSVALALYFRSLKRINSHLRNVTTSIVNPFHRIGYKPKKVKKD